jgi:hypothetical protein
MRVPHPGPVTGIIHQGSDGSHPCSRVMKIELPTLAAQHGQNPDPTVRDKASLWIVGNNVGIKMNSISWDVNEILEITTLPFLHYKVINQIDRPDHGSFHRLFFSRVDNFKFPLGVFRSQVIRTLTIAMPPCPSSYLIFLILP